MKKSKLESILDYDLSYNETGKKAFHAEGKRVLKMLAEKMGLGKDDYSISSSLGGIAVSGDVIFHSDHLYISISQRGGGNTDILYRTCTGRKDYSGHQNNFASIDSLNDENIDSFATKLVKMVDRVKKT